MNNERRDPMLPAFFQPLLEGQSYRNMLYLLISFPLGLAYFIVLVVGLSLGLALSLIGVGIPLLLGMLALTWGLMAFDRQITAALLGVDLPRPPALPRPQRSLWRWVGSYAQHPHTRASLGHLLLRLPLGVFSFAVAVCLLALSGGLLASPVLYRWAPLNIGPLFVVDSAIKAIVAMLVGLLVFVASAVVMNRLAEAYGRMAADATERAARESALLASEEQLASVAAPQASFRR
ncbi:hypothetical protein F8S13_13945 [Chloroflexia bacterium SDU3-3]|nr:hypothetical protein F8S13_13945 [Chloroflexia bacterium SDU3-3]